jgi:fibro-slime domain-containing protein
MASGRGGDFRRAAWPLAARASLCLGLALLLFGACGRSGSKDHDGDEDGPDPFGGTSGKGVGGSSGTSGKGGRGGDTGTGGDILTGGVAGSSGAVSIGGAVGTGGTNGEAGDGTDGGTGGVARGGASGTTGTGGFILGGFGGASGTGGTGQRQCIGTGSALKGILRDFQPVWAGFTAGHPDFEPQETKPTAINFFNEVEAGIVQSQIDLVTRKPLYAGGPNGTNTTIGPAYFPSWFLDTPGVNVSADYSLQFTESTTMPGIYVFDRAPFLPIDDGPNCPFMPQTPCMLGNSRNYATHNFALTFEFHTKFVYESGMSFLFSGDDDVWVFVNGALVVDLGGIHQRTEARLNLGESSGLVDGEEYLLDFFWAERHVTQSNFHIETSLDLINCAVDVQR